MLKMRLEIEEVIVLVLEIKGFLEEEIFDLGFENCVRVLQIKKVLNEGKGRRNGNKVLINKYKYACLKIVKSFINKRYSKKVFYIYKIFLCLIGIMF